jgi:hypothetical protein
MSSGGLNYSLASVLCLFALPLLFGKILVNVELFSMISNGEEENQEKGGRMRHTLGTTMLTISGLLLGINDKSDYFDGVLTLYILAALDRLFNLSLSVKNWTDILNSEEDEKFYKSKTVMGIFILLAAATVISLGDFASNGHYADDSTEYGVALAGIVLVAVHFVVMFFVVLDTILPQIIAVNRRPIVRTLVAGSHLSLLAIHVGHLAASHNENGWMAVALSALVFVDILGRHDGKAVA